MKPYHYLFLLILLSSCATFQKTVIDTSRVPFPTNAAVAVVDVKQPMPDSCKLLGTLKYRQSSTYPSYKQMVSAAQGEARAMGGDLIKVTDMALDGNSFVLMSVFYRRNIIDLDARLEKIADSVHRLKFGDKPNFAILYVYRPSGQGALMGYKLRVDEKVVGKTRDDAVFEVKLYKEGPTIIEAHTETSMSAQVNVKFGEEYYLKCSVRMGLVVGEPVIELMPAWKGNMDYERILKENISIAKDNDDN